MRRGGPDDFEPLDDDYEQALWQQERERRGVPVPLDVKQRLADLRKTLEETEPKEPQHVES